MYILKNAFKSITRNKSRNILIGIVILVISITCTVSLAISNSADKLIESYKDANLIEASISFNRENMMGGFRENKDKDELVENFNGIEPLTVEEIEKYGDSSYVTNYYYTVSTSLNGEDLEKASSDMELERAPSREDSEDDNKPVTGDFTITGYSTYNAMSDFISGNYKITEGEVDSEFSGYNCIINEELATLNDISVGDTITLVNPNDESEIYEFTVTGIYTEDTSDEDSNEMSLFSNSANTIITNSSVLLDMTTDNEDLTYNINPTFILTGEDVIEDFTEEVESIGLDENYQVTTNLDQIENSTSSISNVKTFATTFLIITFIIGAIILFVINQINLRERRYEIGVLRTIGMKKTKVCLQFMTETLMIAIISLALGALIGSFISTPVANKLLENEIESSTNTRNEIRENFGGGPSDENNSGEVEAPKGDRGGDFTNNFSNVVNIEAFGDFEATVSIKVLLELLGLGILLTIISSSSALIAINRFSPLTILKERS